MYVCMYMCIVCMYVYVSLCCVCVYIHVCTYYSTCVQVREQLSEVDSPFYHVVPPREQTQVSRLGGRHLCLLSHLANST